MAYAQSYHLHCWIMNPHHHRRQSLSWSPSSLSFDNTIQAYKPSVRPSASEVSVYQNTIIVQVKWTMFNFSFICIFELLLNSFFFTLWLWLVPSTERLVLWSIRVLPLRIPTFLIFFFCLALVSSYDSFYLFWNQVQDTSKRTKINVWSRRRSTGWLSCTTTVWRQRSK